MIGDTHPRKRERIDASSVHTLVQTDSNGASSESQPYTLSWDKREISDFVVEGYSTLKKHGVIINNPCSMSRYQVQSGSGSFSGSLNNSNYSFQQEGAVTEHWWKDYGNDAWCPLPTDPTSTLVRISRLNALSNVSASSYAFGEDVGEIRETLRYMRNPIESMDNWARDFTRKRKSLTSKGLSMAKATAQVWLTARFALSPLLRSADDLSRSLFEVVTVPKRITARGIAEDSAHDSGEYGSDSARFAVSRRRTITVRSGILYLEHNPCVDWKRTHGLRLRDVPHTVWQLLPYSFMIDRVIDISSAIAGLTALTSPSLHILAGWSTIKSETEFGKTLVSSYNPSWTTSASGNKVTTTSFEYQRFPWIPGYKDLIPPVDIRGLVDDATKVTDLLSLFLQRLRT